MVLCTNFTKKCQENIHGSNSPNPPPLLPITIKELTSILLGLREKDYKYLHFFHLGFLE